MHAGIQMGGQTGRQVGRWVGRQASGRAGGRAGRQVGRLAGSTTRMIYKDIVSTLYLHIQLQFCIHPGCIQVVE